MNFAELGLIEPLLKALQRQGYQTPTPIQASTIPSLIAGKDLLGTAQTGTGKTAAYALPILQRLAASPSTAIDRPIRALILAPTRELVVQIKESFAVYGANLALRTVAIFGGASKDGQIKSIRKGVDILIATPGRLFDIIASIRLNLKQIEVFVLDEADRMLDMGFAPDVKKIVKVLPPSKQVMLFSATMPKEIVELADSLLHDPLTIHENPTETVLPKISQIVYRVGRTQKRDLLVHLLQDPVIYQALVFTRTKRGADRVSKTLNEYHISNDVIHGNKSQNARQSALNALKNNEIRVLVATDIAARGIDIHGLSHVINFDVPEESETYIHRIGRTGRAGLAGAAISFCEPGEVRSFKEIEKLIGERIEVALNHPYAATFNNQALEIEGVLPVVEKSSEAELPVKRERSVRDVRSQDRNKTRKRSDSGHSKFRRDGDAVAKRSYPKKSENARDLITDNGESVTSEQPAPSAPRTYQKRSSDGTFARRSDEERSASRSFSNRELAPRTPRPVDDRNPRSEEKKAYPRKSFSSTPREDAGSRSDDSTEKTYSSKPRTFVRRPREGDFPKRDSFRTDGERSSRPSSNRYPAKPRSDYHKSEGDYAGRQTTTRDGEQPARTFTKKYPGKTRTNEGEAYTPSSSYSPRTSSRTSKPAGRTGDYQGRKPYARSGEGKSYSYRKSTGPKRNPRPE